MQPHPLADIRLFRPAENGLAWRVAAGCAILWLERAWPALRRILAALVAAVAAALLNLPALWGPAAQFALLVAGLAALTISLGRLVTRTPAPTHAAALTRLERAGRLPLGALRLQADTPAATGAPADALQAQWRDAQAEARRRYRPGGLFWPRLDLVSGDRLALGPLLLLGLALSWLAAGDQTGARLTRAFWPAASLFAGVVAHIVTEPPTYTNQAPTTLDIAGGGHANLRAAQGSRLRLSVSGLSLALNLSRPDGPSLPLVKAGERQQVTGVLLTPGRYRVRLGWLPVVAFTVAIDDDRPPVLRFVAPPRVTTTGALAISWSANDDFGLTGLWLELERDGEVRRAPLAAAPGATSGLAHIDLTPDPWAGQRVTIRLAGIDQARQQGVSAPQRMILPERQFSHPVARAVIGARRAYLADPESNRALTRHRLMAIAQDVGAYEGRLNIFTGLRSAYWRLNYDKDDPRGYGVARLLWDVAVDLESGGADKELTRFRSEVDKLLDQLGAGEGAPADLADRLQQSLARYLSKRLEQMRNDPAAAGPDPGRTLDTRTLDALMRELRERMTAGDRAGAQELVQALRSMVENLRFGAGSGSQGAAAQRALKAVQSLQEQQRQIQRRTAERGLAQSFQQQGQAGGRGVEGLSGAQQRLAGQTQGLTGRAGAGTGAALEAAAQAMQDAAARLAGGDMFGALANQSRANAALQQAEQAARAMAQSAGGGEGGATPQGIDPLGRASGAVLGPEFRLPTEAERRVVERLRRTLEQRAADPARSSEERAYYQRLLKRF